MSLTLCNDPSWTSFSDLTTKFNSQSSSVLKMDFLPTFCCYDRTTHLYTVELAANIRKPWMNYVNNALTETNISLLELLFVINIQIFDIYILLLATGKKIVLDDKK